MFRMADSNGNQNLQGTHFLSQFQGLETNPEIYKLSASEYLHQENNSVSRKEFFNKPENYLGSSLSSSSSSKRIEGPGTCNEFYHHGLTAITDSPIISPQVSFVDDSSFPCEGIEMPGKGLSLSLNSSNPCGIGLQSFKLRQEADLTFNQSSSRFLNMDQRQHYIMQQNFQLGKSKFLGPTQELLNEFCHLATNKTDESLKPKIQETSERQDETHIIKQSLCSLNIVELQKRTTKLLQMLEEVDNRYKYYCNQMKAVVSSFETLAGNGAATFYLALASRAMTKHFRRLKYGILRQIKATKMAMGDKDFAVPGRSRGETPRLRLLDQALRQQRAFPQMDTMDNHPWRPQRGLPETSVSVLRAWLFEHFLHPYPNDVDKHILARQTGLSRNQVSNWFINARVRIWKPMVEEMYLEESKDNHDHDTAAADGADQKDEYLNQEYLSRNEDVQKPTHRSAAGYGTSAVWYGNAGGGGGVSLTLGLHQRGSQSSHFYERYDHMDDCQTVQYQLLEGENQIVSYGNLNGALFHHHLAG